MEARIVKLESVAEKTSERLGALERDVAVIRSNYATKADVAGLATAVAALEATLLKWFIGTAFTIAGLAFAAAKLIN